MLRATCLHVAVLGSALLASPAIGQCQADGWRPVFPAAMGPANGSVRALLTTGAPDSQITYAGGAFTEIARTPLNRIGAWNGTSWQPLGPGFDDGQVQALVQFNAGAGPELYAAGTFTTSNGVTMNRVARWDGSAWHPLGVGLDGPVNSLAVFDDGSGPSIYATGSFTLSGDRPVNRIARWDGTEWQPLGLGLDNQGNALAVWDEGKGSSLYVGGAFLRAGGAVASRLARWDGADWSRVGTAAAGFGVAGGEVLALCEFNDGTQSALYFGSNASSAGLVTIQGTGLWNGSSWKRVSWPIPSSAWSTQPVRKLSSMILNGSPALLAGGDFNFSESDGLFHRRACRLSAGSWTSLTPGRAVLFDTSTVWDYATHRAGGVDRLIVGGNFGFINGRTATRIAALDIASQRWLTSGIDDSALAIAPAPVSAGEAIVIGGTFTSCGEIQAARVALWDGVSPRAMSDGFNARVNVLHRSPVAAGGLLYAGGRFTLSGTRPAKAIALWDGLAWQQVGGGIEGNVLDIASDDASPDAGFVACGQFTSAGGVPCANIARWNGQAWQPLGPGFNGPVYAVEYFGTGPDRALYAGGTFTRSGETPVAGIARWNGTQWTPVAGGIAGSVAAVYALKDASNVDASMLVVGGAFTSAGSTPAENIATFNGHAWQPMGAGLNSAVYSVEAAWTGDTQGIFAGGVFSASGEAGMSKIARWDGTAWRAMRGTAGGLGDAVQSMCITRILQRDLLVVAGNFTGSPAGDIYLATWRPCIPCPGDVNNDGFVDGTDLGTLLGAWGPCTACTSDLTGDAVVDGDDLGVLLSGWGTCPD